MREAPIEAAVVDYARSRGWVAKKWSSPSTRGTHDDILFKAGLTFTIEFKASGKKASKLQRICAETLLEAGIPCFLVDAIYMGKTLVDTMTEIADARLPYTMPIKCDITPFFIDG